MGRIMRVNLSTSKVVAEDMAKEYRGLGGRGLSSYIVGREVPPKADPLGPENKLIFSAGILAGTTAPNTGRLSVGAKSPLTNGVKEANAGGSAAQKIARLGFQAVVIEGRAKELTLRTRSMTALRRLLLLVSSIAAITTAGGLTTCNRSRQRHRCRCSREPEAAGQRRGLGVPASGG
jgi:hypothetical protein